MHVSEQNSFLPFWVGRTYLRGFLFSPHQMQELPPTPPPLLDDVPLLPAELLLPAVNLRGVLPELLELPLLPPLRLSEVGSVPLLPLLLVMLLLLLLGELLPDADITKYFFSRAQQDSYRNERRYFAID